MQCLEDIIRALRYKADAAGDPDLLKNKINELIAEIKKNELLEERRKRENLHKVIRELKKENKSMREDMRKIKENVERSSKSKDNEYLPIKKSHDVRRSNVVRERSHEDPVRLQDHEEPPKEQRRLKDVIKSRVVTTAGPSMHLQQKEKER